MSQSQTGLDTFGVVARPGQWNIVQKVKDAVRDFAIDIGVSPDYFTAREGELADSTGILRYQHKTTYKFPTGSGDPSNYGEGEIEFRTTFYTLTSPDDEVKTHLANVTHQRVERAFNTGPYDGYMDGFNCYADSPETSTEEDKAVAQDEIPATGLGVPAWHVAVYDEDGDIAGYASGYALDFGVEEQGVQTPDAPEGEVWKVRSFNQSRGDYQISPTASLARERAKNISGKTVILNGMPIGTVVQDGRVWLTKEHQRPGAATYRSRKYITENTGTPYQALSPGSKVYKVQETSDRLVFTTSKPRGFVETAADAISPDATGLSDIVPMLSLDDSKPTEVVITEDVADNWALGKYNPVVSRRITTGSSITTSTRRM